MHENVISGHILTTAFQVHTVLGPGLMEAVYGAALTYELRKMGLRVATQVALPVIYDGVKLEVGYRLDLLVEDKVIVDRTYALEIQEPPSSAGNSVSVRSKKHLHFRQIIDYHALDF